VDQANRATGDEHTEREECNRSIGRNTQVD
jgi:hypothetical protein